MKKMAYQFLSVFALTITFSTSLLAQTPTPPLSINGRLKVINRQLCNEAGSPIQLRGMSTHGLQWFGSCYTNSAVQTLATSWGCDVLRAAMYVDEGGYLSNKTGIRTQVENLVDWSEQAGMYCIVDWHILNPGDPNLHTADAIAFFAAEAQRNAGKKNVIYELCNEPNGVSWASVKSYAEQIIPVIRQYDPEAIILVGTPNWSGTPGDVASNPITGANAYNVMYTFHFYAGSHYSQSYIDGVLQQIPLFISEWGTSNYSGNGGDDYTNAQNWINLFAGANTAGMKVSWCNWSFCDKSETSAALNAGACGNSGWNNTSTTGTKVKNWILSPLDSWSGTTTNQNPTASITSPTSGSTYNAPASITINANATDADGTISKVDFYNGSTLLGTDTSSPYSFTWSNVSVGTYIITAKATDNSGGTGVSGAVSVTVNTVVTNQNPTITITSPANNAAFNAPASITINANATDADGTISKVDFYNGSTLLGTDTSSPYSFTWSNVSVGTYIITAKATDNSGGTASTTVQVVVNGTATADIIGASSVSLNDIQVYQLTTANQTNATGYSWWCTGSTQSISPTAASPSTTINFGSGFAGGQVCVGVNYSASPWYKQFCKSVSLIATPPPSGSITGPTCASPNQTATFSLSSSATTGATAYSWWCTGSTQSLTPVAGQATIAFSQWFTGGDVCVGVSYSMSPWYKQYCTTLAKCAARLGLEEDITTNYVYPNPSTQTFSFKADADIKAAKVLDQIGLEHLNLGAIKIGQTVTFGEGLKTGMYILQINYDADHSRSVKLVKSE